jgi:hypothetical protein
MGRDKPKPGIYPREQPRATSSAAEITVYYALRRQLPQGWYCWHSLAVFTEDREEGEGDFVIAVPERGMLVLEVKGGRIELRDGRWVQNGIAMEKPPLAQAHQTAELIRRRFEEAGAFYPPFGHGVVFPDTAFGAGGGPDAVRDRVLDQYDLLALGEALPRLVERAVPRQKAHGLAWIEKLHDLWGESWIPDSGLGTTAALDEDRRIQLDREQLVVIESLLDNARILVSGGAGTGKTIIAREAAMRFAADGGKVLLLCFTDALAVWLRSQIGSSGITVSTVRRFARDLLGSAGRELPSEEGQDREFWESVVKRALDEAAAEILGNPWHAVVVDEGQDLTDDDWQLVEALVGDRGRMWAFYDPAQAFWTDRAIPSKLFAMRFNLRRAYRCDPSIQALADLYLGRPEGEASAREGIEGGRIRLAVASRAGKVAQTVGREFDLLLKEGFERRQIAVVSVVGQGRSGAVGGLRNIRVHKLVRADDPAMEREVVGDTFLRFKGLERPAVIVTDLSLIRAGDPESRNVRMHIALTRAQSALRIVADVNSLRLDPVLTRFA